MFRLAKHLFVSVLHPGGCRILRVVGAFHGVESALHQSVEVSAVQVGLRVGCE